jgi:hypothetical protein
MDTLEKLIMQIQFKNVLKLICDFIYGDYNYESKPEVLNVPLAMCNCKSADIMR